MNVGCMKFGILTDVDSLKEENSLVYLLKLLEESAYRRKCSNNGRNQFS